MSGPGMRGIPGIGDGGDTAAVTPIIGHADTGQHSGIPPPPTLSRTKYSATSSYPASWGAPKIQIINFFFQIHRLKYPDTWSIGINPSLNGSLKTDLGIIN